MDRSLWRPADDFAILTDVHLGPPPCHESGKDGYGFHYGSCLALTWLVCKGDVDKASNLNSTCWGLNRIDDCAFDEKLPQAPTKISIWYKTNGR